MYAHLLLLFCGRLCLSDHCRIMIHIQIVFAKSWVNEHNNQYIPLTESAVSAIMMFFTSGFVVFPAMWVLAACVYWWTNAYFADVGARWTYMYKGIGRSWIHKFHRKKFSCFKFITTAVRCYNIMACDSRHLKVNSALNLWQHQFNIGHYLQSTFMYTMLQYSSANYALAWILKTSI